MSNLVFPTCPACGATMAEYRHPVPVYEVGFLSHEDGIPSQEVTWKCGCTMRRLDRRKAQWQVLTGCSRVTCNAIERRAKGDTP